MDRAGNIVARHPAPQKSLEGEQPSLSFIQEALAKTTNVLQSAYFESGKQLYALSTVDDGTNHLLYVQVAVPRKLLFAEADARFGGSLAGMFLIGCIVLFFAWRFSKKAFLRPVGAMLNATEQLIDGNLEARTGVRGRSELHVLAQRFDVMAGNLANRQKELEDANVKITKTNAELEQRVEKRTEELKALNAELEAFSYSVSHDLQAPLRHIDGFAGLLAEEEDSDLSPKGQRYLGTIRKAAAQMGNLISDLLSFSKTTRQEMAVERVNTTEMVNSIVEEIKADEPDRQITWEIQALPAVLGDAALLRQVWLNLISNAVKYTRGKTPAKIEIFSFEEGQELVFGVADNGAGFDMAYAQKLFGVFQRLHRQDEFPGTGIGLANVRRIIERHGGRTWAEGEVGKGAKFFFALPKPNEP
jgi:signal transduction histidine kinase